HISLQTALDGQEISVGFGGKVRLGKWVPVFVEWTDTEQPNWFEVEVLDGDDTPVIYEGPLLSDENNPKRFQAHARIGRVYGDMTVRLYQKTDNINQLLVDSKVSFRGDEKSADLIPSTQRIFLTIEDDGSIQKQIESLADFGQDNDSKVVVSLSPGQNLPISRLGYDGVDCIVMTTTNRQRLSNLSERQISALEEWIENGGRLIWSCGKNCESFLGAESKLARFGPGRFNGTGELENSRRLELLSPDSGEQLIKNKDESLTCATFESVDGIVEMDNGKTMPLIIRRAKGLGEIDFISFDLDSQRLLDWGGFPSLISKVIGTEEDSFTSTPGSRNSNLGNSVSHFGYKDIIGQLKVPLGDFKNVRFVAFTLVACLIGLYILLIGPGDYFFLSKLTGKMELTWITFPLLSILFCGLAFWIASLTRPSGIQINKLEIVDVDGVDGRTRGSVWTNIYSPTSQQCSIGIKLDSDSGFQKDSEIVSWHGLPGEGMGGMKTRANPGLLTSNYRSPIVENQGLVHAHLQDVSLQDASTKPLFAQWWGDNPVRVRSRLRLDDVMGGQLLGTFTNPFDFEIKNARLIFDGYAYNLDRNLEPNETIDIAAETREQNLKSLLTRRVRDSEKKNRSSASPWDPESTNANRILDIMMFYQAAGGKNYTGLTHDYQSFTDMTDYVKLGRAVLVGEIDPLVSILEINDQSAESSYDQSITLLRVIYPVALRKSDR
ncbi:MAG: hypothetical protein AAF623_19355, partial [Planctomycetota bacterium]